MNLHSVERSPVLHARLAGVCYLAIIVLGIFGEVFVRGALVVSGDAAATLQAISGAQTLWRAGIVGDLMMHVLDIPVLIAMYLLLRPVSRSLALLATGFNLIQTAVLVLSKLNLLVPLFLIGNAGYLNSFQPDQLQALSQLAIKAHGLGFGVGLIFFGFACLVRGYLLFRSGYFPKILGVLMTLAGLCYLVNSFALLLAPALADALFPAILLPAFVGELAFALWLVIKGVRLAEWGQAMAAVQASPTSRADPAPRDTR